MVIVVVGMVGVLVMDMMVGDGLMIPVMLRRLMMMSTLDADHGLNRMMIRRLQMNIDDDEGTADEYDKATDANAADAVVAAGAAPASQQQENTSLALRVSVPPPAQ